MLEKLKAIEARLTEVERQLSDPSVYGDRERLTAPSLPGHRDTAATWGAAV